MKAMPSRTSRFGVDLFGEQAKGGDLQQSAHGLHGLVEAAEAGEGLHEPERAGQEGAFGPGQPIVARGVAIQVRSASIDPWDETSAADRVSPSSA